MTMFLLKQKALKTLIALSAITDVSSFAGSGTSFLIPRQTATADAFRRHAEDRSSLSVLIYGWDGDDDECTSFTDVTNDVGMNTGTSLCSPVGVALAESISQDRDRVGTLARLAAAFSPPERAVDLANIENVHLVCVSEKHIEIEAVLCEEHDCVSLFVPIEFPHDCGPDATHTVLEKCVLDNLHYLDTKAESLVVATKVAADGAEGSEGDDLEELCRLPMTEYPGWWVPPECSADLVAECDTISRLLSDSEFQSSVDALAHKGLEALGMGDAYEVKRAVVAAVGPAGICLKAKASSRYEDHEPIVVLDVPLPFGGEPRMEPQSLRAAVLGEVAAAQVF